MKDLTPASDLVEGLLNNTERPPVFHETTGLDCSPARRCRTSTRSTNAPAWTRLVTNGSGANSATRPKTPSTTCAGGGTTVGGGVDDYVWVFLISGAAPAAHFVGGYAGASSERQPSMYFRLGGGTLKGVSKPGWIVWSRVYVEDNALKFDTGLGEVVALPEAETEERWKLTTPQWPIMHAVLPGITRDQMMGRHKANHIQVVYAPDKASARRGLFAKAAAMKELGLECFVCGEIVKRIHACLFPTTDGVRGADAFGRLCQRAGSGPTTRWRAFRPRRWRSTPRTAGLPVRCTNWRRMPPGRNRSICGRSPAWT